MTSRDAIDGGADPLRVDTELFDEGPERYHSPTSIKAIATELRITLDALEGKGTRLGGNVNAIMDGNQLSSAQIGAWDDAVALSASVGSANAGRKFVEVYQKFIDAYRDVVEAVEASAASHAEAAKANEGGK
ncbi:hypothetical protein HII36_45740 [Nonomuraea sp. NN258]|uniref:hypothetical protein n=1 Tax=Nonomuraea antri TaxID=2730852 RepID=UPI0015687699|nr:hypothetical protein [Nonomuraea antri]NRQ39078.1 hypothetical protein [Nonomuraea antri]